MKKSFLLALISFMIAGCSTESVQLKDRRGNKYIFKPDFVSCWTLVTSTLCEGQAIKQDMSGRRYTVQLDRKFCDAEGWEEGLPLVYEPNSIICAGARKLGKYTSNR